MTETSPCESFVSCVSLWSGWSGVFGDLRFVTFGGLWKKPLAHSGSRGLPDFLWNCRVDKRLSHEAHNLECAGSSPAPATNFPRGNGGGSGNRGPGPPSEKVDGQAAIKTKAALSRVRFGARYLRGVVERAERLG